MTRFVCVRSSRCASDRNRRVSSAAMTSAVSMASEVADRSADQDESSAGEVRTGTRPRVIGLVDGIGLGRLGEGVVPDFGISVGELVGGREGV